ncbi:MAG: ankyrin repeat domain-containing protein [Holosporales bacterium]|jgi:ankyrin repeat protein|nr:ankyrin repeat domain-containing protein [Holosporales bacterium]
MFRNIMLGSFCILWGASVFVAEGSATTPAIQQQEGWTQEEKDELLRNGEALEAAICNNQVDKVRELIEKYNHGGLKLDINNITSKGSLEQTIQIPALHIASKYGRGQEGVEIVKLLAGANEANVNVLYQGRTPADVAAALRKVDIYEALKNLGGKINNTTRFIMNCMAGQAFRFGEKLTEDEYEHLKGLVEDTELIGVFADRSAPAASPVTRGGLERPAETFIKWHDKRPGFPMIDMKKNGRFQQGQHKESASPRFTGQVGGGGSGVCRFGQRKFGTPTVTSRWQGGYMQGSDEEKLYFAMLVNKAGRARELIEAHNEGRITLDINAPIKEPSNCDPSPLLHHAVMLHDLEILELLASARGADVNVLHDGETPADVAAKHMRVDFYEALKKRGGKIHARTRAIVNGRAGQLYYPSFGDQGNDKLPEDEYQHLKNLVQGTDLLDEGTLTERELLKNDGELRRAISWKQVNLVKALLDAYRSGQLRLNINGSVNGPIYSPSYLHIAMESSNPTQEHTEIVKLLVGVEGIEVNVSYRCRTPADIAAEKMFVDAYDVLRKNGGKIHEDVRNDIINRVGRFGRREYTENPDYSRLVSMVQETGVIPAERFGMFGGGFVPSGGFKR